METKSSPEKEIQDLGGCGRYQMRISIAAHAMKMLTCWGMVSMIIIATTPPWWCDDATLNITSFDPINNIANYTDWSGDTLVPFNESHITSNTSKSCTATSGVQCTRFRFTGRSTLVSEFDLVCDEAYVPSLIMSLIGAGSLVGNPIAGQLSDLFGRKRPFMVSIVVLIITNVVCFLSNSWVLFAASRFFMGMAHAAFMTTKYSLLSEFTLSEHRAWVVGFPSWPIEASLMAGLAWWLQDWRYIQLACVIVGLPCLLAWWIMPESFRWHLAHDRHAEAETILAKVAKVNKKPRIELWQLDEISLVDKQPKHTCRKYTFIDIFKSKYLVKVTLLLSIQWLTVGFASYGIKFGVQALSGNLFLNIFLFSVNGIPAKLVNVWLENKFGRRITAMLGFMLVAVGGYAAGIVHYIDTTHQGALINWFAFLADVGIVAVGGTVQTMTIELFPTVIRSVGFGSLSVLGRIGAIVGPQFVFLSTAVPGLIFLTCGLLSTLSVLALLGLTETKNKNLHDNLHEAKAKP